MSIEVPTDHLQYALRGHDLLGLIRDKLFSLMPFLQPGIGGVRGQGSVREGKVKEQRVSFNSCKEDQG